MYFTEINPNLVRLPSVKVQCAHVEVIDGEVVRCILDSVPEGACGWLCKEHDILVNGRGLRRKSTAPTSSDIDARDILKADRKAVSQGLVRFQPSCPHGIVGFKVVLPLPPVEEQPF